MSKIIKLVLNRDFRRLYYRGKCCTKKHLVIYASKNRRHINRIGFTCGKVIGNAVRRNRAKRLMSESYRCIAGSLAVGYDIVFVARTAINGKKLRHVSNDMCMGLKELGLLDEKCPD